MRTTLMAGARLASILSIALFGCDSPLEPDMFEPRVVGETAIRMSTVGNDLYCVVPLKISTPYPIRINDMAVSGTARGSGELFVVIFSPEDTRAEWGIISKEMQGMLRVPTSLWPQGQAAVLKITYALPGDTLKQFVPLSHHYVCIP